MINIIDTMKIWLCYVVLIMMYIVVNMICINIIGIILIEDIMIEEWWWLTMWRLILLKLLLLWSNYYSVMVIDEWRMKVLLFIVLIPVIVWEHVLISMMKNDMTSGTSTYVTYCLAYLSCCAAYRNDVTRIVNVTYC